jgi:hypothetical protein
MSISKYTFLVGAMTSILAASTAAADDVAASVAARLRDSGQLEDYRVNVKESEGTVFLLPKTPKVWSGLSTVSP